MPIFYLFKESNVEAYAWYGYYKSVAIVITMIAVLCVIATSIDIHLTQ